MSTKAGQLHRGIDRDPTKHLGPAVAGILERGGRSWLLARWQEVANRRLHLAQEAAELVREKSRRSVTRKPRLPHDIPLGEESLPYMYPSWENLRSQDKWVYLGGSSIRRRLERNFQKRYFCGWRKI